MPTQESPLEKRNRLLEKFRARTPHAKDRPFSKIPLVIHRETVKWATETGLYRLHEEGDDD